MNDKPTRKKLHYVNNPDFLKHMKQHTEAANAAKEIGAPIPRVSDYIGECIVSIANKLVNRPNFTNYPFREEMVSDGIENSLQYLNNFDPSKSSNPFAYFTQIIYFAFIRRIQKEKRQLYTKYRMIGESLLHDIHDIDNVHANKYGSTQADQNMHEFVKNFENSREARKNKMKESKKIKKVSTVPDFDNILTSCDDDTEE